MNKDKKHLRLKYFIRSGIQAKFLRVHILLAIFTILVITFSIYQLCMSILGASLDEIYPPGLLINIYKNFNTTFTVRLLLILVVLVITSFVVSHRVAGPAYHIERNLDVMAKGDLTKKIYLRRDDELKAIANNINKIADISSQRLDMVGKNLERIEKLSQKLSHPEYDAAGRQKLSEELIASLKEIRNAVSQLNIN